MMFHDATTTLPLPMAYSLVPKFVGFKTGIPLPPLGFEFACDFGKKSRDQRKI
jgi:hypothetical protein